MKGEQVDKSGIILNVKHNIPDYINVASYVYTLISNEEYEEIIVNACSRNTQYTYDGKSLVKRDTLKELLRCLKLLDLFQTDQTIFHDYKIHNTNIISNTSVYILLKAIQYQSEYIGGTSYDIAELIIMEMFEDLGIIKEYKIGNRISNLTRPYKIALYMYLAKTFYRVVDDIMLVHSTIPLDSEFIYTVFIEPINKSLLVCGIEERIDTCVVSVGYGEDEKDKLYIYSVDLDKVLITEALFKKEAIQLELKKSGVCGDVIENKIDKVMYDGNKILVHRSVSDLRTKESYRYVASVVSGMDLSSS